MKCYLTWADINFKWRICILWVYPNWRCFRRGGCLAGLGNLVPITSKVYKAHTNNWGQTMHPKIMFIDIYMFTLSHSQGTFVEPNLDLHSINLYLLLREHTSVWESISPGSKYSWHIQEHETHSLDRHLFQSQHQNQNHSHIFHGSLSTHKPQLWNLPPHWKSALCIREY